MNHCTLTYASGIVWFLVSMSAGYAQSWPDDMFDSIKHDFGYVPWGYLSKRVVITNRTDQPVHIFDITRGGQSVSVAKMDKHWIQAGDSVCVELVLQPLNTRYRRSEVLSVQFDHPRVGKSTLRFDWFTRGDLVFDPPQIQFGPVKKGTAVERLVNIEYAGDLNWKIRTATCSNPSVDVQIKEKRRELTKQGFARVSYELCANLSPDAPLARLRRNQITQLYNLRKKAID